MAESISLLDFLLRLINDEDLREDFNDDPEEVLEAYNLTDLSAQDVYDALILAQDSHQASFDRNYDTGHNYVPPVPAHAGHSGGHHDGGHSHKEAVEYINKYITNNY
ncbi:IniB N-terminal domain-containing protein, partial [Pseudonocardia sulfidoxydans]